VPLNVVHLARLAAEKATESDAINQAVVERGIRDSKAKADKAHYATGNWPADCLAQRPGKAPGPSARELQGMLQAAAAANDDANGAHYAEELATLEQASTTTKRNSTAWNSFTSRIRKLSAKACARFRNFSENSKQ